MIEALASRAIVIVTRLVSRASRVGSRLTHIGQRCSVAALRSMCLVDRGNGIDLLSHSSGHNPAKAPSETVERRAEVLAVDATSSAYRDLDVHSEISISRDSHTRDHAGIAARVMDATAALRVVLREERAHVEAGEVVEILNLRARKFAALANWRALVEQLPASECTVALGTEAVEIEAYARKTFDLMAELLVARSSQRRGVC